MNTEHELLLITELESQAAQLRQYDREARAREWYLNGQIKELRREVDELKSRLAD
ncbi:MAG: hypothetical protein ACTSPB_16575 [Candidatus Thorarchaeota archaeon]